ncbi:MAG: hypothetical protein EA344_06660 [Alkalicoccus sp.]|nr:MAG: hypothetical protein EA344_06660 [Alkalicoccus sp.]
MSKGLQWESRPFLLKHYFISCLESKEGRSLSLPWKGFPSGPASADSVLLLSVRLGKGHDRSGVSPCPLQLMVKKTKQDLLSKQALTFRLDRRLHYYKRLFSFIMGQ